MSKVTSLEQAGCRGCVKCVKRTCCVYDVYSKRLFDSWSMVEEAESVCRNCMRCVQECKNAILSRAVNPRYESLGDEYWQPKIISTLWEQAKTGSIPVSGSGYNGPFTGPGFDQMWTDMSEIVRPTRDGIHGREYISTVIELGRRPKRLAFDEAGELTTHIPPFLELPVPFVFDIPPFGKMGVTTRQAMAAAAEETGTLMNATLEEAEGVLKDYRHCLIVKLADLPRDLDSLNGIPMVEFSWSDDVLQKVAAVKQKRPETITSIRLNLDQKAPGRASKLAADGAEVIHLQADFHGRGFGEKADKFIIDLVREIHLRLVDEGCRDRVTILVSGGVALAEHVAKGIICGADGVGLDLVLLVAMECHVCRNCTQGLDCPVQIDEVPVDWGKKRITNLMTALHSQLIEVMGAMGLREVRRLRGEMGRAMLFEDLEQTHFAPIFGNRLPEPDGGAMPSVDEKKLSYHEGFPLTKDKVVPCPSRYRNPLSRFKVLRSKACIACGKCEEICQFGVHKKGGKSMLRPQAQNCRGPEVCKAANAYCVDNCPENALQVGPDPVWKTFGDARWPNELLVSTWLQAETGRPPENGLEYRVGQSGGGFDRMDIILPDPPKDASFKPEDVDLTVPLNRRKDDNRPRITLGLPLYGGGMSFGSVSQTTMLSRTRAYKANDSFNCTGEGGYPEALAPYADNMITQVATGLFGVREQTIQRVRIVEFKYAQGAKPGLGGHLLGDKVTPAVARMREAVQGSSLFSPFPFHSVYSVEDHKKHLDWIKQINDHALVSVKVSTPVDVDMVAVGSYYAGAHIVHLDGSYGGTGAAPDIAKKNIAMPIEYAIPFVHRFLKAEGIRDQVTLVASGGLRTAWDIVKAIALGADAVVTGTADMVALECIRCTNCESGRGCPRGIATTDPELSSAFEVEWGTQRVTNLFHSWALQLQYILWRLGMKSVRELVGRDDVLRHLDYRK